MAPVHLNHRVIGMKTDQVADKLLELVKTGPTSFDHETISSQIVWFHKNSNWGFVFQPLIGAGTVVELAYVKRQHGGATLVKYNLPDGYQAKVVQGVVDWATAVAMSQIDAGAAKDVAKEMGLKS
jgi:hypothetical protein